VNQVLPVGTAVATFIAIYAAWRCQWEFVRHFTLACTILWTAAAATALIVFPMSFPRMSLAFLLATAVTWRVHRVAAKDGSTRYKWPIIFAAASVGIGAAIAQRGESPSTVPLNRELQVVNSPAEPTDAPDSLVVASGLSVHSRTGRVSVRCGSLTIDLMPMLTFESRSADRCWTIFAMGRHRIGQRREFLGLSHDGDAPVLAYRDDASHYLRLDPLHAEGDFTIEATTSLPQPVFSHLNSFTELQITGHRKLSLSFSPCADDRIEVKPADYPVGRPARFAYVDSQRDFHLVEASSGEKGPFHELAAGKLPPDDPLTIHLWDEETEVGRMTFFDWPSQLSTALSPTAGWGVPVNAIEFRRAGLREDSLVSIWLTLAGTSVGRGWDSVGHATGTYRNRIRIDANQ
jgi:hypothetical protein